MYSQLENKGFEFSKDGQVIVDMMGSGFFDRLKEKQESLYLNLNQLSTFQRQCFVINDLLIEKKKCFWKCISSRKKFRFLINKVPQRIQSKKIFQLVLMSVSTDSRLLGNCLRVKKGNVQTTRYSLQTCVKNWSDCKLLLLEIHEKCLSPAQG